MAIRGGSALYVPVEAVTRVLDAYQRGPLPPEVTLQALRDVGTPDSVAPRTLRALENLGLVSTDGKPTDALRNYAAADERSSRSVFGAALQRAYADVFASLGDVVTASSEEIDAAFKDFEPATQRHRMVRLFLGLCEYAGLTEGRVRRRQPQSRRRAVNALTPRSTAEQHTVELASGGEVTLLINVRLFELSGDDRAFLLDLVDRVRDYGQRAHR